LKRLFLHIGFNKTGSTSLQQDLATNTEALARQGILYPHKPQAPYMQRWQHVPLAAAVPGRHVPWLSQKKRKTLGRAYKRLFANLRATPHETLVLSSESFGGVDLGPKQIRWIRNRFAKYDTTVVAYIRRQDAYFLSTYQQNIKAGDTKPFGFDTYASIKGLHFAQRLAPWRRVFGADKIIVRPFDPHLWPEGELYYDFLQVIDADRADMTPGTPANEGLDYRAVDLLRRLNLINKAQHDRDGDKTAFRQRRQQHLALVESFDTLLPESFARQKMKLSTEQVETLRTHFRADNIEALAGTGIDPDDFFAPAPAGQVAQIAPDQPDTEMLLELIWSLSTHTRS